MPTTAKPDDKSEISSAETLVGRRLHSLRTSQGFSLRGLAESSGLNINTLSLIENGKSSPSVSTLQQLSRALKVPLSAFFEFEPVEKQIVFTPADQRPLTTFGSTRIENLGEDLANNAIQPFIITLEPGMGSGDNLIVHTGHEFVYCLAGSFRYLVDQQEFIFEPGDSLVFEAHLPHCWENNSRETAQILLVLIPSDENDAAGGRHFSLKTMKKEITLKIAVITDDGKSISQHFGRAPYYLVLTIEEGIVVNREMREKLGHTHFNAAPGDAAAPSAAHGMDSDSHNKHINMAEVISDCKALLCGGMGRGAYESMRCLDIQPVVTELSDIDEAVQAFIDGKLVDHTELLH